MSSDNDIVFTHNLFVYICLEILRMMINYYRQNEMRRKIAIRIVSLLSLRYDHFVTNLMIV